MKIHNKYWIEKKFTDFKSIFDLTNSKFNNNFHFVVVGFLGTLGPGGPLGSVDGPLGCGSSGVIHSSGITGLMTLL